MKKTLKLTAVVWLTVMAVACASGGAKKPPTGTPDPDKLSLIHI